ncbi:hypothetical protein [Pseudooceanicola spongiae]|uniref:Helix-turn-helix domain-containing protein n=1 Tax=Pseudooceanicola spongiae TaxID=2613965 RepID=A0A7L9WR54_9RHOB|nr:hypothetical protein [Pseudooceanicola spongiae]QOL82801.1 hypothetical protein F3W81_19400 [Pseudooceanicola spongiae]
MNTTAMTKDAATEPEPEDGFTVPEGYLLIAPADWERQRWHWLKGVRRDGGPGRLSPMARLVAHALALDFAHHLTARCDPLFSHLTSAVGASAATVKRALAELEAACWIVRDSGRGKGRQSRFGFLTRPRIAPLKGGGSTPPKSRRNEPSKAREKAQNCSSSGSDMSHPYNKDKPYKNHKGREGARELSQNPMVRKRAEDAVRSFRGGRSEAFAELPRYVLNHIIAADLLTPLELQTSGIF